MPKATKLHAKGKATSIQKPCRVEDSTSDAGDPEETARQFQLELCWCIQQLERTLMEKKGTEKQCKFCTTRCLKVNPMQDEIITFVPLLIMVKTLPTYLARHHRVVVKK